MSNKLAVITGASTGIGRELALLAARDGYDLVVAADEAEIESAAEELRREGVTVSAVQADLSQLDGVDQLVVSLGGRPVDCLFANAGKTLGHAFLDENFEDAMRVVNTNIVGTIYLVQTIGRQMRTRGAGKILITGSIAGLMPGTFSAVYNGTKAFLNSFSVALRNELKDTGVSVSCLMPGATDTAIFARADMLDTKVAQSKKDDAADVARTGYDAMMNGEASVVHGMQNKVTAALAKIAPQTATAEQHRKMAEPGSGKQ